MFWFTQEGQTALMCAVANHNCDVITELISLGADVDIQTIVSHFHTSNHGTPKLPNLMRVHSLLLAVYNI